jgi:predicted ester cyclase
MTYQGEFVDIAPTGRVVESTNIGIVRIYDGKWVELWVTSDSVRMMQQLGAITSQ